MEPKSTMLGTHPVTCNMSRLYKNHSELCSIKPSAFATAQWGPFWRKRKTAFAFADLKTQWVEEQHKLAKAQIMTYTYLHLHLPSSFFSIFKISFIKAEQIFGTRCKFNATSMCRLFSIIPKEWLSTSIPTESGLASHLQNEAVNTKLVFQ